MKPFNLFLAQTLKSIFEFIIFLDRIKGILAQKFLQGIFKTFWSDDRYFIYSGM
jgi:hypothetical protein